MSYNTAFDRPYKNVSSSLKSFTLKFLFIIIATTISPFQFHVSMLYLIALPSVTYQVIVRLQFKIVLHLFFFISALILIVTHYFKFSVSIPYADSSSSYTVSQAGLPTA